MTQPICNHVNTLQICAKCPDGFHVTYPNTMVADMYSPPAIRGLTDGEYVMLSVCIDCSVVIGMATASEILKDQPVPPPPKPPEKPYDPVCQVCGHPESEKNCVACE